MSVTVGNHVKASGSAASATVTTGAIATTSGSVIDVFIGWDSAQTFTSLTENGGNGTPLQIGSEFSTGFAAKIRRYRWENIIGNAAHTFTVTLNANCVKFISVIEFKGVKTSPLDTAVAANADAASPFLPTATGTLAQADEAYSVGIITDSGSNPATFSESTGMTIQETETNGTAFWTFAHASKIVTATTSLQASFTDTGATNAMLASATFMGAASSLGGYGRRSPFKPRRPNLYFPYKVPPYLTPAPSVAQVGQPWFFWQPQERVEAEDDIYRQPNTQLLHRYRFNFQTVGQQQAVMRWRTSTPETPEPYDVLATPPLLHRYRQSFQTVGQSYRLWSRGRITLEPEESQTARPADLTPFRATTSATPSGGQPWFIWFTPKIDWDIDVAAPKANHELLHRYRFAFQTVGQSWQYWIKPQARLDDEPNAPAKIADLSPFRQITITTQPGQPWFMFPAAEPDLTVEPDAIRTDHAAALYPFRPHPETIPTPVTIELLPAGRHKKYRYFVEIDDQQFQVDSPQEAVLILLQAQKLAPISAERSAKLVLRKQLKRKRRPQINLKPPKIETNAPVNEQLASIRSDIESIYRDVAITQELAYLFRKQLQIEQDDDEDVILLLH